MLGGGSVCSDCCPLKSPCLLRLLAVLLRLPAAPLRMLPLRMSAQIARRRRCVLRLLSLKKPLSSQTAGCSSQVARCSSQNASSENVCLLRLLSLKKPLSSQTAGCSSTLGIWFSSAFCLRVSDRGIGRSSRLRHRTDPDRISQTTPQSRKQLEKKSGLVKDL